MLLVLLIVTSWYLNALMHEVGHAATLLVLGGEVRQFVMVPGIQFWPTLEFITWNGFAGMVWAEEWMPGTEQAWFELMGAGTTLILAYLGLPLVRWTRGNVRLWIALFSAFCAWDVILYSILPPLGIRHWLTFGGYKAEPYDAALKLEIFIWEYWVYMAVHVVFYHALFTRVLRRSRPAAPVEAEPPAPAAPAQIPE